MLYWIIFGLIFIVSIIASKNVERKFKQYSTIPTAGNLTGREVAELMLSDHRIHNVTVREVQGSLTDHYNPADRTLNLSHDVYHGTSVAAAAVAAHECGHAVQHANAYAWLKLRSLLVPAVNVCNKWVKWILLGGIIIASIGTHSTTVLLLGICLYAVLTLFTIVTLPVEVDASRRALAWLETHSITTRDTHPYAVKALRAAAYTYFMAAIASLADLLYYILIYLDRR